MIIIILYNIFKKMDKTEPTHKDIDDYICESFAYGNITESKILAREIEAKSGVGALLHPAEEYFLEMYLLAKKSLLEISKD
jgi:hypothetical protein